MITVYFTGNLQNITKSAFYHKNILLTAIIIRGVWEFIASGLVINAKYNCHVTNGEVVTVLNFNYKTI